MAKKSTKKQLEKQSKKTLVFLVLLLLLTNIATLTLWFTGFDLSTIQELINPFVGTVQGNVLVLGDTTPETLDAYYIDIVNIGDSNLIQVGDFDILVDAGEKRDGTDAVVPFLTDKVKDGVIELTVVTHSDSDHNGGFSGLKDNGEYTGVYYSGLKFKYITDYGYKEKYEDTEYEVARKHALEFSNGHYQSINDAFSGKEGTYSKVTIGDNFVLEFIDTKYYDIYGSNVNDRSIVFIMTYFGKTFFFGGDINDDQEKLLIKHYDLPKIDFYKASHHGSITSNCKEFLDVINPSYIFLNTEIGNQHNIPNIKSLDIIDDYADDNIYLTGVNGTINVHLAKEVLSLSFANNDTKFENTNYYTEIMNGNLHK